MRERPWSRLKVEALIEEGWYWLRAKAYDTGYPELTLDPIQLDRSIRDIPDIRVRAAAILRLMGMDTTDIGYALGGRSRYRTGERLVSDAITAVAAQERRRWDMRRE